MKISAPTKPVFIIAVVTAIIGFIVALGVIPGLTAVVGTIIVFAAFALLAIACVVKGM